MDPAPPSPVHELTKNIRSEQLPELSRVLDHLAPLSERNLLQVTLILDTNAVLADLRWLVKKRTSPSAKTHLMELLACRVVKGYAPKYLQTEIRRKIPVIAKREGMDAAALRQEWETYQSLITFVDVGGPRRGKNTIDPKDTPYLRLQKKLRAPILTEDRHISAMRGHAVDIEILPPLRRYSRQSAVEFQLVVHGLGALLLLALIARGGWTLLSRLPVWLLVGAGVFLFVMLLHPPTREKLFAGAEKLLALLGTGWTFFEPLLAQHTAAKNAANESRGQVEAMLAPQPV